MQGNPISQKKKSVIQKSSHYPRHKGEEVVLLVADGVFRELLLALLRVAEPDGASLQLLPPPTHSDKAIAAAVGGGVDTTHNFNPQ